MENLNNTPAEAPTPQYCQTCKHWTRRMLRKYNEAFETYYSHPTSFGLCKSSAVYKATDVVVKSDKGGDLYNDDDLLVANDDLNIAFYTRQDFGCVFYQALPEVTPAAPG